MSSILDRPAVRDVALSISVQQYHRLGTTGIISEQTELLRGVIVRKMIKSPQHTWLVQKLAAVISGQIGPENLLRQEQPLSFADSEPEPDLAVVPGMVDDYRAHHPAAAKLVIEVAITSEQLDREKAGLYAEAGVDEYWLVLIEKRCVEQYSDPANGEYKQCQTFGFESTIISTALPSVRVDLSQFN